MERSPQEEINEVVNVVLSVAQGLINEDGTFAPFGAIMDKNGQVGMVVPVSEEEDVSMEQAREMVYKDLCKRAAEGEIRGSAVCLDIRMREPRATDAILVAVEHVQAQALNVYMPYTVGEAAPADFGAHWAERAESRVFA